MTVGMKTPLLTAILSTFLATTSPVAAFSTNCPAEIKATVAGIFQHGPFEMTSTMDGISGRSLTVGQIVPGEAMHSHTEVGGHTGELIIADGRMWRRSNDGPWTEHPLENDYLAQLTHPPFFDALDVMVRPRCLGLTESDGRTFLGYRFGIDTPDITIDLTFYASPDSRLMARVDAVIAIAGDESSSTALYRYDPTITIEPPM